MIKSDDGLRSIQVTEIEALRAIFADDFEQIQIRSTTKIQATPFEFRVKVKTQVVDLQDQINLSLRVRLPRLYPNTRPTLVLENPVGLSKDQLDQLREALNHRANELVGSEMLFELVSFSAEFITDNNSLKSSPRTVSLIEERITRSLIADKEHQMAEEAEQRRKSDLEAHENLEFVRQIEKDINVRAEQLRQEREKFGSATGSKSRNNSPEIGSRVPFQPTPGDQIQLRPSPAFSGSLKIQVGLEITNGNLFGKAYDARVDGTVPSRLTVVQPQGRYYSTTQGKKILLKVLDDLNRLRGLENPNLETIHGSELAETRLTIVSEPVPSASMSELLENCGPIKVDKALEYFSQLSQALHCIHCAQMVHRAIRPQNIYLVGPLKLAGEIHKPVAKLFNVSWFQRLWDMCKSNPFCNPPSEPLVPDPWLYPHALNDPLGYGRERDLFDLGVTFAQMLFGEIWSRWESPNECLRNFPESCPIVCKGLLESLLHGYKKTNAEQIAKRADDALASLSSSNRVPSTQLNYRANSSSLKDSISSLPAKVGVFWQPSGAVLSRYRNDFDEVEFLGRGGFGEVVKAKNKLDNRFYAVKKISLPMDPREESKILREVTILSRMSHPHIVRYHACWIETGAIPSSASSSEISSAARSSGLQKPREKKLSSVQETDSESSYFGEDTDSEDLGDSSTVQESDSGLGYIDFMPGNQDISMPSIRFGDSSRSGILEGDGAATEVTGHQTLSPSAEGTSGDAERFTWRRTLFMQMEFVDSLTLREAIDQGIASEREVWKISRQILSAMAYFTSLNVIHRDLKPSNIFLDAKGDVRIGDFGLAVNQLGMDVEASANTAHVTTDLTSGVGTTLYIAPETLEGKHISLKNLGKIDIYSFGILLFEMFHKFPTVHERIQVIKGLRSPEIKFPSNWSELPEGRKARVIKWCLNHLPELRPSPTELLKSSLFPPQPGDENMEEITRLISRPDHAMFRPYLASLFDQPLHDRIRRDFTYDFHTADTSQNALENPYRSLICDRLTENFRQRGAINMESPVLLPIADIDPPSLVKLLDTEGTVVALHFDATVPFARTVARDPSLIRLKRYSLSPVYKQNLAGGQPMALPTASYDVVSPIRTLAAEAEVIQLTDDSFNSLPLGTFKFQHVISHNKLWKAIFFDIPTRYHFILKQTLERFDTPSAPSWNDLTNELVKESEIPRANLDFIKKTFDIRGSIKSVATHLLSCTTSMQCRSVIKEAIEDLKTVIKLAETLGIQSSIIVWPMLVPSHRDDSDGIFFNTCDSRTGKSLAIGGRYDGLVEKLTIPGARNTHARSRLVSVTMNVSRLSLAVARQLKGSESWMTRRCDVYVLSFSSNLLQERLEVVRELWASGHSADLMYESDTPMAASDVMLQTCRREGIIFAVIVKARNPHKEQVVKVKNLLNRAESEVSLMELAVWIDEALIEHRRSMISSVKNAAESNGQSSRWPRTNQRSKQPSTPNSSFGNESSPASRDYLLILPSDSSRKLKHKSRLAVYDKAFDSISDSIKFFSEIPICVIDLEDDLFNKLFVKVMVVESLTSTTSTEEENLSMPSRKNLGYENIRLNNNVGGGGGSSSNIGHKRLNYLIEIRKSIQNFFQRKQHVQNNSLLLHSQSQQGQFQQASVSGGGGFGGGSGFGVGSLGSGNYNLKNLWIFNLRSNQCQLLNIG
ncbi:PEK/GCN2 protein kinase [Phakopsora pachyrhizi]|uniref:non-specific serine/threonine protein kinase n=1 Tax=Phakopsora pachyrhizi TaxID=170000 RepID=A0AAV0AFJ3_PHAPC|nr:PEK/GCN2 protein kinase [Phakopsora pachyrhizi]